MLDQGKSFRDSLVMQDQMILLQPLVQCCVLRDTTFEHLRWISRWKISLSEALTAIASVDIVNPLLSSEHLAALDRRMNIVQDVITACLANHEPTDVIQGFVSVGQQQDSP